MALQIAKKGPKSKQIRLNVVIFLSFFFPFFFLLLGTYSFRYLARGDIESNAIAYKCF